MLNPMHQLPADLWNQIARETQLATPAAKAAFSLTPEQQETLMDRWAQAEMQAQTPAWARVPLMEVLPLLAEQPALSQFKARHPEFLSALPEVNSPQEAAELMTRERQWSQEQSLTFLALLQSDLPLTRWQQSAQSLLASN